VFIGGLARVADAKCVVITFSYPNASPHSMIHVTRCGVLRKHPPHASVHASSRTHCRMSDVISSEVS
jgi:hypothetical protein